MYKKWSKWIAHKKWFKWNWIRMTNEEMFTLKKHRNIMPLLCKSKFIFRCNFAETISNCTFSPCQWIENTRVLLAMAVYIIIIIAIHLKCEIINAPNSTSHTNNNNNSNEYNEYNIKQAWIWWQMITLKVHVLQSDFVLFTESGASERAHKMLKCAYDMAFERNNVCDRPRTLSLELNNNW